MNERGPRGPERKEPEPATYHLAARFDGEQSAGRTYLQVQDALFADPTCDLSSYRLQLNRAWHVAVIGQQPVEPLDSKLRSILASGDPVTLPHDILQVLLQRRAQATTLGPWVERHHRPGKRL